MSGKQGMMSEKQKDDWETEEKYEQETKEKGELETGEG